MSMCPLNVSMGFVSITFLSSKAHSNFPEIRMLLPSDFVQLL